jgi:hypothetical protein
MRQGIKDVLYVLAVVAASVIAAIAIGWLVAGCSGQVGDTGDSGDTDSETETEEWIDTDTEWNPLTCDAVIGDYCAAPPWQGTYVGAVAHCAELGPAWFVPPGDVFADECECDPWDKDEFAVEHYCEACDIDLDDWPNAYWTSSIWGNWYGQEGEDIVGNRWLFNPGALKWFATDVDFPVASVRCIREMD